MIIGENRVVERGGVLTARGTANSSEDPNEQPHRVVNRSLFVEKSCMAHSNFFCRMCTAQVTALIGPYDYGLVTLSLFNGDPALLRGARSCRADD